MVASHVHLCQVLSDFLQLDGYQRVMPATAPAVDDGPPATTAVAVVAEPRNAAALAILSIRFLPLLDVTIRALRDLLIQKLAIRPSP